MACHSRSHFTLDYAKMAGVELGRDACDLVTCQSGSITSFLYMFPHALVSIYVHALGAHNELRPC